ncbi:hypothetical protein TNCV_3188451 [Trichonephila clavipes]|nr:hypothetical protein TNCV_3188451 [Trichonephila clavipes]
MSVHLNEEGVKNVAERKRVLLRRVLQLNRHFSAINTQIFNLDRSNATHALLSTSEMKTEGMYGCEVSTETPQFRTIKAEKELYVYEGVVRKFRLYNDITLKPTFEKLSLRVV